MSDDTTGRKDLLKQFRRTGTHGNEYLKLAQQGAEVRKNPDNGLRYVVAPVKGLGGGAVHIYENGVRIGAAKATPGLGFGTTQGGKKFRRVDVNGKELHVFKGGRRVWDNP